MMPESLSEYELTRVYFIVSSKWGEATLSIDHYPARQSVVIPVYPSSAVDEVLPLLRVAAAHYARQWQKIMVPDPEERDARGFSLPGSHLPSGIAPSNNADKLLAIARKHVEGAPEGEAWLSESTARVLWDDIDIHESNKWEFAHEAEVLNEFEIALIETDGDSGRD